MERVTASPQRPPTIPWPLAGLRFRRGSIGKAKVTQTPFRSKRANGEPWSLWSGVLHPQRLVASPGNSGLVALRSVQTETGVPAVSSRVTAIPRPLRGGNSAVTPPRTHLKEAEWYPSLPGPSGTLTLSGAGPYRARGGLPAPLTPTFGGYPACRFQPKTAETRRLRSIHCDQHEESPYLRAFFTSIPTKRSWRRRFGRIDFVGNHVGRGDFTICLPGLCPIPRLFHTRPVSSGHQPVQMVCNLSPADNE